MSSVVDRATLLCMTRSALFIIIGCAGCAPATAAIERPPLVRQTAERLVDDAASSKEQIREILIPFLAARWAFDVDSAAAFVTDDDRQHVAEGLLGEPPQWLQGTTLQHRVVAISADADTAEAVVEVAIPDEADTFASGQRLSFLAMGTSATGDLTTIQPVRHVETVVYRLLRQRGEWRVRMDWERLRAVRALAPAWRGSADRRVLMEHLSQFAGSEAKLIQRRYAGHPGLDAKTQQVVREIEAAEGLIEDREFDQARAIYDELEAQSLLPPFAQGRRDDVDLMQSIYDEMVKRAEVETTAVRVKGDSLVCDIRSRRAGIRAVRVGLLMLRGDERRTATSVATLDASGRGVAVFHPIGTEKPGESKPRVLTAHFAKGEKAIRVRAPGDTEFAHRLQDLRTDGRSQTDPTRISAAIRRVDKELDACENWPAHVDVRVEVGAPGSPMDVQVEDGTEAGFAACVTPIIENLALPTSKDVTAIVRLYAPGHWYRAIPEIRASQSVR